MTEDDTFNKLCRPPMKEMIRMWEHVTDNTPLPDFVKLHRYTLSEFLGAFFEIHYANTNAQEKERYIKSVSSAWGIKLD